MTLYIKCGNFASIYFEINKRLGVTPLLKIEKYKNEIIVHIPYMHFIYTPKYK